MGKMVYGSDTLKNEILKAFPKKKTVATANALLEKLNVQVGKRVNKDTMRRRMRELVNEGKLRVDGYLHLENNRFVSGYRLR